MNKEKFDNLTFREQIDYINLKLQNQSFKSICDHLGIPRTTLQGKLSRAGFFYDKDKNSYVESTAVPRVYKSKPAVSTHSDQAMSANSNELMINHDKFKGKPKPMVFKVYPNVMADFEDFMDRYQHLKKQSIATQVLYEFLKNHDPLFKDYE